MSHYAGIGMVLRFWLNENQPINYQVEIYVVEHYVAIDMVFKVMLGRFIPYVILTLEVYVYFYV